MKKLLIYLNDYKKESILGPLFKLLEAVFELFVPLVIAAIIDNGIKNADKPFVIRMSVILITLGIVGFISSATAQFYAAKAAVGFVKNLKNAVFAHVHSLSFADIDKLGTSNIITGLTNDMNQILNGVNLFLRLALRSPFVVFGAMFMAMTIDVKSSFIFGSAILLLSIVVFIIMFLSLPIYKKIQNRLDSILGLLKENLSGVRVIRAFRLEDDERANFISKNLSMFNLQKYVVKLASLMNPLSYVIANFAILFLIYKGGIRVNSGTLTQGEVVALYSLMTQISVELIKTARLIITITRSLASARRVTDILETKQSQDFNKSLTDTDTNKNTSKPNIETKQSQNFNKNLVGTDINKIEDKSNIERKSSQDFNKSLTDISKTKPQDSNINTLNEDENKTLVEFKNVSLKYNNAGGYALKDISFSAKKGETIGIIGGTGSGKTSLVHLIPRFYDATDGKVLINDIDVKLYPEKELRQKVGIVMQRAVLFSGSVRQNISWGKENAADDEIYKALEIAQIKDYVMSKGGLDFMIEEGGTNLSGGQRQRMSIARAIVRQAEILILDDSSSALDYASDAKLRRAIRENCKDSLVFIVSQRTSSVMYANKIITLSNGEIAGIGSHENLLETCQVYREIYNA